MANEQTTFAAAFNLADEVLHAGVRGVTDLMVSPGLINLDFADIRTVMGEMGKAMMGTGEAEGENRALEAAEAAINNPLLDNASIDGARGVLINVTGGSDVTLMEVDEAATRICQEVADDANIIFGTSMSTELEGQMRVAVIATGIDADLARKPVPEPSNKVHVLGISNRKGGGQPSSGAFGAAEFDAPEAVVEEVETPEPDSAAEVSTAIEDTASSDSGITIALNSVEQSFDNVDADAAAEPEQPSHATEPMMIENSPPKRKMVPASSAGGVRAGVVTRNHFHFGGAGKYSRMALAEDCIGFATSAHRFTPGAGQSILSASGGSPMSFAIPAGQEPPIVIDMGAYIGGSGELSQEQLFQNIPAAFFKFIGLGAVAHMLGGFMAGIWMFDSEVNSDTWEGANQGAFICAIDISRFRDPDSFKQEVDRHQRNIQRMTPAPGYDQSNLPGTLEYQREQEWAQIGIPISPDHQSTLNRVAEKLDLDLLFAS